MMKIDFVVTWVDGRDAAWQAEKARYSGDRDLNGVNRFRDMGVFEYWFKNVFTLAPWVNQVYLVTDRQRPAFLDRYPQVKVVDHTEIIDQQYLPTFDSNTIELNLWKIKGLSEHFVLFNDDMFITKRVTPGDFFSAAGQPRLIPVMNIVQPGDEFSYIPFNNMELLNQVFNKRQFIRENRRKIFRFQYGKRNLQSLLTLPYPYLTGFFENHLPIPHLKSTFQHLANDLFPQAFHQQNQRRFRTRQDISQWLAKNYNILSGSFAPADIKLGQMCKLRGLDSLREISQALDRHRLVCINDDVADGTDWDQVQRGLVNLFKNKFGEG